MVVRMLNDKEKVSRELEQWIKKLKCTGSTGISLDSFPDIKIGIDPAPVNRLSKSYEVYPTKEIEEKGRKLTKTTDKTPEGKLTEDGEIVFENGDTISGNFINGRREGYCDITLQESRKEIIAIRGQYKDDLIHGKARIYFKNWCWLEGYFKFGIQHGFTRIFDKKGRLKFVGNFQNGIAVGVCWKIIRGGGCVVGRVDQHGELTGCRIAYIYPDFHTALVGSFIKGTMQSAQQATIESIIDDESGVKMPVFSRPSGHVHNRQIGTYDYICKDPLIRDPYELRFTEVQRSRIPGASEGIFTKQDIEPNTIIAFYNGSRADPVEFDPTTWETNNYRIFDPADIPNGTIDIPIWAQDVKRYCGTLAHKCNHSFLPNAEFVVFDHPKFGLIPCITSTTDIYAGEEILVGYGYDLNDSPDWYTQAWHNSIFAAQGVSYQDWMDCNVKRPFNIKETRRDA